MRRDALHLLSRLEFVPGWHILTPGLAVITDVRTFVSKMDDADVQALIQNIRLLKEQFERGESQQAA